MGTVLNVEFTGPERVRSRQVLSRSRAGHTGTYPSWKVGRTIHWESIHELNAFRILDADPKITIFAEQPCVIHYQLHGQVHRHYPDVRVESRQGKELWEIKPDDEAIRSDVVERTTCLVESMPKWGYKYRIVRGSEIAVQPRLRNALTVLRFGRYPLSQIQREFARRVLRDRGEVTWDEATSGALGPKGRFVLCRLTLEGLVEFDSAISIAPTTTFRVRSSF